MKILPNTAEGFLENFVFLYVDTPAALSTFAMPTFAPIYHLSVYQFHTKYTEIYSNLVLFMIICSK